MTQLYCLVQNNAVVQGPVPLPFSSGNITGLPSAPDPTIYGWYPYSDPGQPAVDGSTQSLARSFTIDSQAKTVTQAYAVSALPLAQIQANQDYVPRQSHAAKLKRQAAKANASGDTKSAVDYLLQQRSFP
jgi:hypothetical protein